MWLRYIDDTYILWPCQEDVQILLDHVNSIWPSYTVHSREMLSFLDVLLIQTEQGFRLSVSLKPTFTGQYWNFNSHHPYKGKKGIIHYQPHGAKVTSRDSNVYQEEKSLRDKLHCNNYPESITLAPRNLDWMTENNIPKNSPQSVCLKSKAENIWKLSCPYDIRTIFTSSMTLWKYLCQVKPQQNTLPRILCTPSHTVVVKCPERGYANH